MKKALIVLSALLVVASGFFFVSSSRAETSTQDQYCAPGAETDYDMLGAGGVVRSQTFEPSQNRLTEIDIKIGGLNLNGGTPITVTLYGPGFGGPQLATKTIMPTVGVPSYRSWTFSSPVTVIPGETYRLVLEESGAGSVYWYYGAGDANCDGKNRTYAFRDSTHMTWDWNYKTSGYTVADPGTETGQTDTGSTGSTTATTSGETLGEASMSIVKPTNLTAEYSDADKGIKLAWKASTTSDIGGYKIFRSESADKGFAKVKEVGKTVLNYTDQDIAAGKTYYYQVRAYKAAAQSYSSNTASAKVPDDIAPAKPKNLKVVDSTEDALTVRWTANAAGDLKKYTINLYRGNEKIRTKELHPTANTYSFIDLDPGLMYKIELIATSSTDKSSSPATTFGATSYPATLDFIYESVVSAAMAGVLILLLILSIRTLKHQKKKS